MPRVEAQPLLFVAVEATIGVSLSSPNECVDRRKSPGRYARQPSSNKGLPLIFNVSFFCCLRKNATASGRDVST